MSLGAGTQRKRVGIASFGGAKECKEETKNVTQGEREGCVKHTKKNPFTNLFDWRPHNKEKKESTRGGDTKALGSGQPFQECSR